MRPGLAEGLRSSARPRRPRATASACGWRAWCVARQRPGDRQGDHLHAARGRARHDQPDRAAAGPRALPHGRPRRAAAAGGGRLERREGVINVVVDSVARLERPDLPRAEVRHIEPRRTWSTEPASGRADAGDLRARCPPRTASAAAPGNRFTTAMSRAILVGTSSWADPGFVKRWYPRGMPARDRLPWYAERFEAVEVNSTFYAVPEPHDRRTAGWRRRPTTSPSTSSSTGCSPATPRRLDSLPPDMRDRVRDERARPGPAHRRGRGGADRAHARGLRAARRGRQDGRVPAPAHAGVRARAAASSTELEPLIELLAPRPVAVELRHRGWVGGATARGDARRGSRITAPRSSASTRRRATTCRSCPPIDAVTRDDLAYVRMHGRNAEGYLKRQDRRRAVRLGLRRRGARGDRGPRPRASPSRRARCT